MSLRVAYIVSHINIVNIGLFIIGMFVRIWWLDWSITSNTCLLLFSAHLTSKDIPSELTSIYLISAAVLFLFIYLLRLYSTSAEGLLDTKSYSLLKTLFSGQYVWKVADRRKNPWCTKTALNLQPSNSRSFTSRKTTF